MYFESGRGKQDIIREMLGSGHVHLEFGRENLSPLEAKVYLSLDRFVEVAQRAVKEIGDLLSRHVRGLASQQEPHKKAKPTEGGKARGTSIGKPMCFQ